jgi:hypothetical protein
MTRRDQQRVIPVLLNPLPFLHASTHGAPLAGALAALELFASAVPALAFFAWVAWVWPRLGFSAGSGISVDGDATRITQIESPTRGRGPAAEVGARTCERDDGSYVRSPVAWRRSPDTRALWSQFGCRAFAPDRVDASLHTRRSSCSTRRS